MMPAKAVITTKGSVIPCSSVSENDDLPGFFDVWFDGYTRQIMNGELIAQIIPADSDMCDAYKKILNRVAEDEAADANWAEFMARRGK